MTPSGWRFVQWRGREAMPNQADSGGKSARYPIQAKHGVTRITLSKLSAEEKHLVSLWSKWSTTNAGKCAKAHEIGHLVAIVTHFVGGTAATSGALHWGAAELSLERRQGWRPGAPSRRSQISRASWRPFPWNSPRRSHTKPSSPRPSG